MKSYESAGVSINKAENLVKKIKVHAKSTFTKGVLSDIGHFGGFFDAKFNGMKEPVLVSSVDGVGTKLKITILSGRYDTIGQDLVNHCVNDILCAGAKPLFFLDYLAFRKLDVTIAEQIISGFATACKENQCALIGGETAEMPGLYSESEYDISGTIVGVVDKEKIIDGLKILSGDVLIALPSNGLHTNGYSLARKVLLERYNISDYLNEIGMTIGEELLKIHKSYLSVVYSLLEKFQVNGIAHITGGGIEGNTKRILPEGLKLEVDWQSWKRPAIFNLIQNLGNVEETEMREVFNLGVGMILIVPQNSLQNILDYLFNMNESPFVIGYVG